MRIYSTKHPEDFWAKVSRGSADDCWPWTGATDKDGYGYLTYQGKDWRAHRLALALTAGPLPPKAVVMHSVCDNPPCCNPSHLRSGTHQSNQADKVAKGREARGDRSGARLHPERIARGDRSGARLHPERMPRGDQHYRAKVSDEDMEAIVRLVGEGMPQRKVGVLFDVCQATVWRIVHGTARVPLPPAAT